MQTNIANFEHNVKTLLELIRLYSKEGCATILTDNEGLIIYVNEKFCSLSGYDFLELLGENPRMLSAGYTSRHQYLILWNTISSGYSWQGCLKNRRKDGSEYLQSICINPIKGERGEITHFIAMVDEVFEQ